MSKINQLQEIINNSDNIVFFRGTSVSTESGIPDFRSESGIYKSLEKYGDLSENIISHSYYLDHTEEFFEYYKDTLVFKNAHPNPAHLKLAEMEKAGSEEVLELHGSVHRNYCQICNRQYGLDHVLESERIPRCECGGIVKPDVVLYGEPLKNAVLNFSVDLISQADTLIIGGTSLVVYPAAGLINYFNGENLVLINKSKTPYDNIASLVINDAIGDVFSQIKI